MSKFLKYINLFLLLTFCLAFSQNKAINTKSSTKNVAIKGYDVVAYFKVSNAVKGDKEIQYQYSGVNWYFSSAEHRDLFIKNPQKYIPAYGGYCAYAMSKYKGKRVGVDPRQWSIVEGTLYLNYSAGIQKKWNKERTQHIKRGNQFWHKFLESLKPPETKESSATE